MPLQSEQIWDEHNDAMDAIWDLLDKVKLAEVFGTPTVNARVPAVTDSMHIDERVRMAADAKRYRHLRDRTLIDDVDNDLLVLRGDRYLTGEELDREIDNALRLARLLELHPCAD